MCEPGDQTTLDAPRANNTGNPVTVHLIISAIQLLCLRLVPCELEANAAPLRNPLPAQSAQQDHLKRAS